MSRLRINMAETMCDPAHYLPLARAAEDAGYDGYILPDSIAYPEVSDSKYPYTPDGDRGFLEDKPFIDPFCLIPAMGAVTEKLRFITSVVKLPIRHPVLVAKQASSVAVMTNNRFVFGVGSSPWPEDYRICDERWAKRGRRMDEMLEIIRGLTRGGYFSYKGEFYDLESIKICPVPDKPIPLMIGGHSEAALKRAARLGDGWIHAGGDFSELPGQLKRLEELRREYGREKEPFETHVISLDAYTVDGLKRLEDVGVTDAVVGFRNPYYMGDTDLEPKLTSLRQFAVNVLLPFRG